MHHTLRDPSSKPFCSGMNTLFSYEASPPNGSENLNTRQTSFLKLYELSFNASSFFFSEGIQLIMEVDPRTNLLR